MQASQADLEARTPGVRDGGSLGQLQKSINDMIDIVDAYVRKSAASMEYVSRGKRFRKVVLRGTPGVVPHQCGIVINAAASTPWTAMSAISRASPKVFGASMDLVARKLDTAASELESDAGSMAEVAEVDQPAVVCRCGRVGTCVGQRPEP